MYVYKVYIMCVYTVGRRIMVRKNNNYEYYDVNPRSRAQRNTANVNATKEKKK